MTPEPVPLNLQRLRRALMPPAGRYGRVDLSASTGSTNADLLAAAGVGSGFLEATQWPDLSALTAEEQCAGRGRLDRTWVSQAGRSMIVSVLLRPENAGKPLPMTAYSWLSLLAAIALIEAVADEAGVRAELKWPNDVLVNGRKLAGILAQLAPLPSMTAASASVSSTAGPVVAAGPVVIVGTGVNVSQTPAELPVTTATSLAMEGSRTLDRNVLLPAYLSRFAALYRAFCAVDGDARRPLDGGDSLIERATAQMVTLGTQVRADLPGNRSIFGLAAGLDATGSLLLTDALGTTHTVSAGDVVHLRRHDADGARDASGAGDADGARDASGPGNSAKLHCSGISSRYA
ncbi:biotin--[acetyl-CoA-carboxylase] ligase [Arthrobacter sp. H14-L1]|uniref:biotin--[acetyl-CoA-carboxylase] ligase n=1 Tax=Arthrobacter sp. H14-L1 TaxID=2996697 RepID=UPI00227221CA|nr:biotin--[acetyl-CoA-carboxylase] ligase [Arthrobacter sp. H14-L1]MCY0905659.1 biotin--[acetyl-CoA-carboxylase] ligase [Arthrobacter sp. H14-L1]